ncbi:glutathione S-transferase [Polymorphobacter glacialis]|uniref:Glutathione S-transferase n=1 Tax=Sandarakinorhabdus glacialis TaxID=1614636 RepID=A0A916ZZA4_9SPHN|nr:glutathione S-transferase family protein [Polymorphobacter glacialis]GGE19684.1 glutathione S-transferase [Polymorphobacter glacialis]
MSESTTLTLYSHPFSSYCQKVLTALWENDIAFTYRHLEDPGAGAECTALWPIGRFPVLVDGDRTIVESSIIIEYFDMHFPGPVQLIPVDREAALEVRLLDRFCDNYVMAAMQKPVFEMLKGDPGRKEAAMAEAAAALDTAYAWLDTRLAGRRWAAGADFTMADCAAAPSLFYADWVHPIGANWPRLREYRVQLLARPSFARAVEEGRRYRSYFPLGAPDRD